VDEMLEGDVTREDSEMDFTNNKTYLSCGSTERE
jgi:hypothetical protein